MMILAGAAVSAGWGVQRSKRTRRLVSSAAATLIYATLGVLLFGLTAGFSTDYMPKPVVTGAVAMCLPFVFLALGLSSAFARHTKRASPILVAGVLSLVVMFPALVSVVGGAVFSCTL